MSHCGCVHLNITETSEPLGEPLFRFPLKENEEVNGLQVHPHFRSLRMKGDSNDGKQAAALRPAHTDIFGRVSSTRSLLSACGANAGSLVCARIRARDLCRHRA